MQIAFECLYEVEEREREEKRRVFRMKLLKSPLDKRDWKIFYPSLFTQPPHSTDLLSN
jgi:hypothetical protein